MSTYRALHRRVNVKWHERWRCALQECKYRCQFRVSLSCVRESARWHYFMTYSRILNRLRWSTTIYNFARRQKVARCDSKESKATRCMCVNFSPVLPADSTSSCIAGLPWSPEDIDMIAINVKMHIGRSVFICKHWEHIEERHVRFAKKRIGFYTKANRST